MSVTPLHLFRLVHVASAPACDACWDTGVVLDRSGFHRCAACAGRDVDFSPAAMRLAECVWTRIEKNLPVDAQVFRMARALIHATAERPVSRATLMTILGAGEREVKALARELRREWVVPIGSSRQAPWGYFWIHTAAEFLDWSKPFRSQAIDELVTEYRLRQANFPELAGQSTFDFVRDMQRQIEEALI